MSITADSQPTHAADGQRRVGLFGGSFDPIHIGHLFLAEQCREMLNLDEVRFMPTFISPLKQGAASVDPKQRLEMVQLAINGNGAFVCDDREVRRGGVSYTVDTVAELQAEFPKSTFILLMGADSVKDLPRWKDVSRLLSLVEFAAIARGGVGEPDWSGLAGILTAEEAASLRTRTQTVRVPALDISSTSLRTRVSSDRSIRYLVPSAVETYIRQNRLYRGAA